MSDGSHELEIDYFFGDANVQRLVNSTAVWEPLRICYPKEVSVSRFLAWLLDPTQGHGLGDLAIQSLLTRCWWCSDEVDIDSLEEDLLLHQTFKPRVFRRLL